MDSPIQEIEYLRRLYAKATDLIGTHDELKVAEGRAIYARIFTPDAKIRTAPLTGEALTANNPEEWVDVVLDALGDYVGTQHLIGTQLVTLNGDEAHMQSYLSAWHGRADGSAWIFMGTYEDHVRKTAAGWQIYDMTLHETVGGESPAYK